MQNLSGSLVGAYPAFTAIIYHKTVQKKDSSHIAEFRIDSNPICNTLVLSQPFNYCGEIYVLQSESHDT